MDRALAPREIAGSRELASVCPVSAILMFRGL